MASWKTPVYPVNDRGRYEMQPVTGAHLRLPELFEVYQFVLAISGCDFSNRNHVSDPLSLSSVMALLQGIRGFLVSSFEAVIFFNIH